MVWAGKRGGHGSPRDKDPPEQPEVATELDGLAWEMEGEARRLRIIHLREEALKLMPSL